MDIHLPGESGIACTARLREKMPNVQVIMLTVYKDIKVIFQALKAGACGYVLKRSDEKEILEAIAEVRAGGAPMTSEIARMVVRSFMTPPRSPGSQETDQLSARELELLELLAKGFSNKEIAQGVGFAVTGIHEALTYLAIVKRVIEKTERIVTKRKTASDNKTDSSPEV